MAQVQVPGRSSVLYAYDTRGRLTQITQGARGYTITYDTSGNVATVTDALMRTVSYSYDALGRPLSQTLPGGRVVAMQYDKNSNLTSLTPPGRTAHGFGYTAGDQMQSYSPPAPDMTSMGPWQSGYTYNLDGQLTQSSRPDGQSISVAYDSAGRTSILTLPGSSQVAVSYDSTTGAVNQITAANGGTLQYSYDGPLLLSETWGGTVSGSVSRTYDNNLRVASELVNGGNAVSYGYDADGLLTAAGALSLSRDTQNGQLTGTTLGTVSDALTYDSYYGNQSMVFANQRSQRRHTRND